MRINRGLLNWGVFLIALGGIPLAVDQGWLDSDVARDLGQLWPLLLVGIGLGLTIMGAWGAMESQEQAEAAIADGYRQSKT